MYTLFSTATPLYIRIHDLQYIQFEKHKLVLYFRKHVELA